MQKNMIVAIFIVIVLAVVLWFIYRQSIFISPSNQNDLIFSATKRWDKNVFEWITNPLVIKVQDRDKYTGGQINILTVSDAQNYLKDWKPVFITLWSPDIPGIPATIIKINPDKTSSVYQMSHPTKQSPMFIELENVSYLYSREFGDEEGILTLLLIRPTPLGPKRHERIYVGLLEKAAWNELAEMFKGNIPYSSNDDLDR